MITPEKKNIHSLDSCVDKGHEQIIQQNDDISLTPKTDENSDNDFEE